MRDLRHAQAPLPSGGLQRRIVGGVIRLPSSGARDQPDYHNALADNFRPFS